MTDLNTMVVQLRANDYVLDGIVILNRFYRHLNSCIN